MSFPPGTKMVQFPGFASQTYGFSLRYRNCGGLPHSEMSGSKLARSSPDLFAAYHVLLRLSVPRHPPDALLRLDPCYQSAARRGNSEARNQKSETRSSRLKVPNSGNRSTKTPTNGNSPQQVTRVRIKPPLEPHQQEPAKRKPLRPQCHAPRTPPHPDDLGFAKPLHTVQEPLVDPNSKGPNQYKTNHKSRTPKLVEPTGIEPVTSCVQSRRSPS